MWKMVARNHEAIAGFANQTLRIGHTRTLMNPEVFVAELSVIKEFFRLNPELARDRGGPLVNQSLERLGELEQFLQSTILSEDLWSRVSTNMAVALQIYEEQINNVQQTVFAPFKPEDRAPLLRQSLPHCQGGGEIALPTAGEYVRAVHGIVLRNYGLPLESWIPPIFLAEQRLDFGKLGVCYEWDFVRAEGIKYAQFEYYPIQFSIKVFFAPRQSLETVQGRPKLNSSSILLEHRALKTKRRYTTWFASTVDVFSAAWNGAPKREWVYPHQGQAGVELPFPEDPRREFLSSSTSLLKEADREKDVKQAEDTVRASLATLYRSTSRPWNELSLDRQRIELPKISISDELTKDLETTLSAYTAHYLFAKNLALLSAYHENPMSGCLTLLNRFGPSVVLDMIAETALEQTNVAKMLPDAFREEEAACRGRTIRTELTNVAHDLMRLRAAMK
jgi:hypothetical protein